MRAKSCACELHVQGLILHASDQPPPEMSEVDTLCTKTPCSSTTLLFMSRARDTPSFLVEAYILSE